MSFQLYRLHLRTPTFLGEGNLGGAYIIIYGGRRMNISERDSN
jgi:hypothetical protein